MRNLLLISIDSWRYDAVSSSPARVGWQTTFPFQLRTPTLDRLAAEGTTFHTLIVQAPFTPASHASFFTGLTPPTHGIRAFFDCTLAPDVPTLAERLRRAGFHTGAIIGADALNERYGLNRGFETYDTQMERRLEVWKQGMHRRLGDEATDRALSWLEAKPDPFFLFVHYFDVHLIAPHIAEQQDRLLHFLRRRRFDRRLPARVRHWFKRADLFYSRYVRAGLPFHVRQVNRVDREIGRLIAHLSATNRLDNTLVVIMSDHGDAFGEHGETGHREYLYDTTLRVPLIIRPPVRPAARTVDSLVRSTDVLPTVLELLDIDAGPHPLEGVSLLPLMAGEQAPARRAYAETKMERSLKQMDELRSQLAAVRTDRWKLIVDLQTGARRLFDVARDPAETENLAGVYPTIAAELAQQALTRYHSGALTNTVTADGRRAIEQRLRDLGYFE